MAAIEINELIQDAMAGFMAGVNFALPGRVVSYNADEQRALVKPLIKRRYSDGIARSLPIVNGVPVVMPQTARGGLILDVQPGDLVLLVFADRSLDKWVALDGREVDPEDPRRFDMSDAVAIPGVWPFSHRMASTAMRIKFSNGKIAIGKDAQHELLDLLSQLLTVLTTTIANGGLITDPISGPLQLAPSAMATVTQIKTLLTVIKGSL
jgi:hypothetical protein